MGTSADVYASTRAFRQRVASGWRLISAVCARSLFELSATFFPHGPHGKLAFLLSQGGGIYVNTGTVTFQLCDIHNNQAANSVSARILNLPQLFPIAPMGSSLFCFRREVASMLRVAQ